MAVRIRPNRIQNAPGKGKFTKLTMALILIAAGVMLYLTFKYKDSLTDAAWVTYTTMMAGFALVGWFGTQIIHGEPPFPSEYAPFSLESSTRAVIILMVCMVVQVISQAVFSFSQGEQVSYFIFAAVCEEVFFRVFFFTLAFKLSPFKARSNSPEEKLHEVGHYLPFILVQAGIFLAIHQNYYGNLPAMASVFLGGIVLGIFFVVWKDPNANILAHFLLNFIVMYQTYGLMMFIFTL